MAESASCADCGDDRVGIPTAGCDEVMVSCILRRGGEQDGYWYDLSDADLLDRAGPTEGSDVSEQELEAHFESIPGADGRGDRDV